MIRRFTYAPQRIGQISRPTREERNREGDRWVSLRTLDRAPTTIGEAEPPAGDAPPAARKSVFLHAIDQRHAEARRKAGL